MELGAALGRSRTLLGGRRWHADPSARVTWVTAFLTVTAAVVTVAVLGNWHSVAGDVLIPWWGLAVAYFLSGVLITHVRIRNHAFTVTLSEVPLVLGLVASTPAALIAGGLVGTALSLIFYRRQQPLKVLFNTATFLVEADLAIVVMQALLGGRAVGSGGGWLAALAGTLAAALFSQTIVMVVVVASSGEVRVRDATRTLMLSLPAAVLNTILGLSGLHAAGHDPEALALLVIPFGVLAAAYRSYMAERQRHDQVRQLYEASGALHRSRGAEAAITTLLTRARDMFNADVAELIVFPPNGPAPARLFTLAPDDGGVVAHDDESGVMGQLAGLGHALLLGDTGTESLLPARGFRNGIAVAIATDGGVNSVLLAANRRDAVSTFGRADLELLEALAGPAGVSLENGRLGAEIEHQAFHDPLTGLPNRALLSRRIKAALADGPRGGFSLLLLDVDDFKTVNDTLGHPAGDRLLVDIAERLVSCLRPDDTAARLGGDEFAVILRTAGSAQHAIAVGDRILQQLRRPFTVAAVDVTVRASLGIVVDDASVAGVDDLLSRADIAMYRAKARGKDRCVVFEPIMHIEVMARHQLRVDLERAVADAQLCVHYQPIVSLLTGEVTAAEALVRWAHPSRGMVQPDDFIPAAEESGLIIPLGRFVLDEGCRQLVAWRHRLPALRLCVNISARELQDPGVVDGVVDICARHGVDTARVTFEVTEHVMVSDDRAVDALRELRALGARIAIDDFGTGYSSLSCLRDLPIDTLKIAKPFVDRLARSDDDRALATSVVGLARGLRLDTVVEGIERLDQAELMREAGCRSGQGFLFSRAIPAAEFLARVSTRESDPSVLALAGRAPFMRGRESAG
jgi:diguanylate cyclase (GGDEF)-like protein